MTSQDLESAIEKFTNFTQKPVNFLTTQDDCKDDYKNLVKSLYDLTKSSEIKDKKSQNSALTKLIVKDFDEEQVWQQIELQNSECWDRLVWEVANSMSIKDSLQFPVRIGEEGSEPAESDDAEDADNSEQDDENEEEDVEQEVKSKPKSKAKTSIVDDEFFRLKDMEKFLIQEERHGGKLVAAESDEDSIDMFDEIDEDVSEDEEGGDTMKYHDFFNNDDEDPKAEKSHKRRDKKVTFAQDNDDSEGSGMEEDMDEDIEQDSDDEDDQPRKPKIDQPSDNDSDDSEMEIEQDVPKKDEKQSEFELRQQRLKQQISRLEEKNLSEAPWQLRGEVDANKRPQNSLLQEVLDFDLTTRPAPIITEQTTVTLEDIIKRRIKDKAWDDVEKKEKPVDDALAFRKTEVLDHAKSKLSLAQVYEAEYLKKKHGDETEEKEPESHTQIREAMDKLFAQLDTLSHFHYTPKPAQPDVKIVSNTPAINMEEVAPVAASSASLLAPEEIKKKTAELVSKEERTDTDKKRERRKKKIHQRAKGPVTKVTDHRNTKKGVETTLADKSLKTSKAFFQQLNDDSTSVLKNNKRKNKGQ